MENLRLSVEEPVSRRSSILYGQPTSKQVRSSPSLAIEANGNKLPASVSASAYRHLSSVEATDGCKDSMESHPIKSSLHGK